MIKDKFTDKYVKALKPKGKSYIEFEGSGKGFGIRVLPTGVKSFLLDYEFDGKRHRLSLGKYSDKPKNPFTLKNANDKRDEALELLKHGLDPAKTMGRFRKKHEVKVEVSEELSPITVEKLIDEYLKLEVKPNKVDRSFIDDKNTLTRNLAPFNDRPAMEIRRRDVLALLRGIAETAPASANNTLKAARRMWNWAIREEIYDLEANPWMQLQLEQIKPRKRQRALSFEELTKIWPKIMNGPGNNSTKRALLLILVTMQRPGEVIGMKYEEIDPDGRWWTIPVERIKDISPGKKDASPHRVYLSDLALTLIKGDVTNGPVFPSPSPRRKGLPMRENELSKLIRLELPNVKEKFYGLPNWRPHDLRRTASTRCAELRMNSRWVEMVLNHAITGIEGTYNVYQYDSEKKAILERWGKELAKRIPLN